MIGEHTNLTSLARCNGFYTTYYFTSPAKGAYLAIGVFVIIVNISLAVIGSIANGAIIAAYCRNKRLRNEHTMLLCVLTCTELVVTSVLQPLFVATRIANVLGASDHCLLWSMNSLISFVCLCVTMLVLVIISLERFAALHYACRYKTIVTRRRLLTALGCAWVLVLSVAVLHVLCRTDQVTFLFYASLSFFSVVLSVSLMAWMEKLLRRHRQTIKHTQTLQIDRAQIKAQKKLARSTRTTFMISGSLTACYLPGMIMLAYEGVYAENKNPDFYLIVRPCVITFMYVNCALDPCLVLWRNREIRTTVANIFDRSKWGGSSSSPKSAGTTNAHVQQM